jgi:hypothetical protein
VAWRLYSWQACLLGVFGNNDLAVLRCGVMTRLLIAGDCMSGDSGRRSPLVHIHGMVNENLVPKFHEI